MTRESVVETDVLIFGGGASGLWLLDVLRRAGYGVLLLEADAMGAGQTVASQGIIHGGLKYTLSGLASPAALAIREMPRIWRACLEGERTPDLHAVRRRADCCHLWRTEGVRSRAGALGARLFLRVRPVTLRREEWPSALSGCPGQVLRLDEQVVDTASVLTELARPHSRFILTVDIANGLEFRLDASGQVESVRLRSPVDGAQLEVRPRVVVLAAGEGNADLRGRLGLSRGAMQRRPLHMAMLRGKLPMLNGHCADGARTRVTITSSSDGQGRVVWQVGGQVAEDGVGMDERALLSHVRDELTAVLPGVELTEVEWAAYRVDRAETTTATGRRPDDIGCLREGNVLSAWPTKMALVPRLAEAIRGQLGEPGDAASLAESIPQNWPRPKTALLPWEVEREWHRDL
jgi:glycerol-3-phosphate dehydrogenase